METKTEIQRQNDGQDAEMQMRTAFKWGFVERIVHAINEAERHDALTREEWKVIIEILAKKYDEWRIKEILPEDIFFDRLGRPLNHGHGDDYQEHLRKAALGEFELYSSDEIYARMNYLHCELAKVIANEDEKAEKNIRRELKRMRIKLAKS